jgi:hypothetical protein
MRLIVVDLVLTLLLWHNGHVNSVECFASGMNATQSRDLATVENVTTVGRHVDATHLEDLRNVSYVSENIIEITGQNIIDTRTSCSGGGLRVFATRSCVYGRAAHSRGLCGVLHVVALRAPGALPLGPNIVPESCFEEIKTFSFYK